MKNEIQEIFGGFGSGSGDPPDLVEIKRGKINNETIIIGRNTKSEKYVAHIEGSKQYRESFNLEALESWFFEFPNKKIEF